MGKRDAASATDRDWEELARRDPYFAVLTDDRYRGEHLSAAARVEFYASGGRHVDTLFADIEAALGETFRPARALDFGCGVGRVLGALAARSGRVVGADVATGMLDEARRHCAVSGLDNVELVRVDDSLGALAGSFDLIHSALVFQHIEVDRGERLLDGLCRRLTPGGVAALHFTTASRVPRWAALLARARRGFRPLHTALNLAAGRDVDYPLMQMNLYDPARLARIAAAAGCEQLAARPWREQHYSGVLLLLRRPPRLSAAPSPSVERLAAHPDGRVD